jgi:CAAX protease family protein
MENESSIQTEQDQIKPAIKYGWLRALLFLLASIIASSIGQAIGLVLIALLFGVDLMEVFKDPPNIMKSLGVWSYFVVTLLGFLPMLLIVWVFRRFIDRKSFISLGFSFEKYKSDFIQGMIWGVGLIVFGFVVLMLFGALTIDSTQLIPISLLGYILMFFIVSLNEEIMVRGYLLNNLSESVNKYLALVITASLFGIMHLGNANISAVGFVNIILAGILLGIYYVHKQNLWFPIGIHFTWNLFQGPVLGFEVSGFETVSVINQTVLGNELLTGGEFGFEASLLATILMVVAIIIIHFQFKDKTNQT